MTEATAGRGRLGGIAVLYEDNHLLLVVKPPGLAVQGGTKAGETAAVGSDNLLDRLKAAIKARDHKPGAVFLALVHRLDQPVGGLLLLAKTSKAASRLDAALRDGEWHKTYLAVCCGNPMITEARLSDRLIKDRRGNHSRVLEANEIGLRPRAKEARLSYRVLRRDKARGLALLRIELDTGRSHQIRVQLAHAGLPLYGDYRYNPAWARQKAGDGIALWAFRLAFPHPVTREMLSFSRLPEATGIWLDFADVLWGGTP